MSLFYRGSSLGSGEHDAQMAMMKRKYRANLGPIILVLGSLLLTMAIPVDQYPVVENSKWISLLGLLWYIFNLFRYRPSWTGNPPNGLLAPVFGKVLSVDKQGNHTIITIKKAWLAPTAVRLPAPATIQADGALQGEGWSFTCQPAPTMLVKETAPGGLYACSAGSATISIKLDSTWHVHVMAGQKVKAGEQALADRIEENNKIIKDDDHD